MHVSERYCRSRRPEDSVHLRMEMGLSGISRAYLVPVRAVVTLPGWYVTQSGPGDILVFNGKLPDTVFPKVRGARLLSEMIQRIAHQVEAKCRDVAPRAYADPVKEAS